jgi:L-fuconolactonase
MVIVDSQVHIWAADTPARPWPKNPPIEAHPGPLSAAALSTMMEGAGVHRAILIPPSWEGTRNELALAAAKGQPNRFAVMGRLAIEEPDASVRLERFPFALAHGYHSNSSSDRMIHRSGDSTCADHALSRWLDEPGMLGLRMNFRSEPYFSWLHTGTIDWLFPVMERHGIPLMIFATRSLSLVARIAERHPGLRIAIDHMGMIVGEKGEKAFAEEAELIALARHANVSVKATALPCAATDSFPYPSLHDHIRAVFEAFGPHRFFWGTDLTQLPCSYADAVNLFTQELPWLHDRDLEHVMGRGVCEWLGWDLEAED